MYEVIEMLGGTWAVLVNGVQVGGAIDPELGCGTAEFCSQAAAESFAQEYIAELERAYAKL